MLGGFTTALDKRFRLKRSVEESVVAESVRIETVPLKERHA